jgi:N4-gp56 family major capsid protein
MNKHTLDLQLFAESGTLVNTLTNGYVNAQTGDSQPFDGASSLSGELKTFYDTELLENARTEMFYAQFAKKQVLPAKHGNSVEWRKWNTFAKADKLEEGVIPTGQKFGMSTKTGAIEQYGTYATITDTLELRAYDDIILGATEEMGAAEGETYDTLTRNILVAGNSVHYCPNGDTPVTARSGLTNECVLTPDVVNKAQTWLKKNKAPKIDGYYVALIHPSVAYDLRNSEEWKEYHKYNDVAPIFKGEIGELHGVRFVETNAAKIWKDGDVAVYATLFLGKDAFGILDPEGEGMEMIIKTKEQIGGPLNQFGTIGYKFCHGAKILYQERILRVESGSSLGADDTAN